MSVNAGNAPVKTSMAGGQRRKKKVVRKKEEGGAVVQTNLQENLEGAVIVQGDQPVTTKPSYDIIPEKVAQKNSNPSVRSMHQPRQKTTTGYNNKHN